MSFEPKVGLVVRFDFLWKEEEQSGLTEGRKDRPCAIIVAMQPKEDGSRTVVLSPITHTPPTLKMCAANLTIISINS